jgi:hypothetical protein
MNDEAQQTKSFELIAGKNGNGPVGARDITFFTYCI